MKYRPKSLKSIIILVVLIIAATLVMNYFGIGTQRSAVRVGYTGNDGWRNWSANYTLLDGWLQHTIRPETDTVRVEVTTESGKISIEMKDTAGNVLFSENDIKTTSFEVEVPGKVVIKVEADNHKGGFLIE